MHAMSTILHINCIHLTDVGINLFEGDIVLTNGQEEILQQAKEGGARQQAFQTNMVYRWDDGVVPFVLHISLSKLNYT